nr:hypothetical protein Iba_chr02bCG11310 [Ipomoea batatas]
MTSENNCIIEDVDNACVEMPSDEIGVKEHDNFCDEPYDDSFDHNCGDAYIENVVGNVDCVVDNVHANPLENVGDINAKHDDENCFDTCENNSFNSNDNDGLELFTFDDNSLLNEHVGELHDMLCNVDDELNRTGEELVSIPAAAASRSPECVTATVVVHGCYLVLAGWDRAEGCCCPRRSSLAAAALLTATDEGEGRSHHRHLLSPLAERKGGVGGEASVKMLRRLRTSQLCSAVADAGVWEEGREKVTPNTAVEAPFVEPINASGKGELALTVVSRTEDGRGAGVDSCCCCIALAGMRDRHRRRSWLLLGACRLGSG